jgi:hypothetical protein
VQEKNVDGRDIGAKQRFVASPGHDGREWPGHLLPGHLLKTRFALLSGHGNVALYRLASTGENYREDAHAISLFRRPRDRARCRQAQSLR